MYIYLHVYVYLREKSVYLFDFEHCIKGIPPEDRFFFNRVISVISVVERETTLTITVSTGEPVLKKLK